MRPVALALPGNEALAARLDADPGRLLVRRFPDGETFVRIDGDVAGRGVALVCTLDRPDAKTLPLLLVAATARDLGAARIGLVAPYLGYLRQDARFAPGEGVTSRYFARLLATGVDWLVTVDPHLHRWASLADVYAIPATAVRAAPLLGAWIRRHVADPIVVGPDAESAQWVAAVAREAGAPSIVLEKRRHGDREVEVSAAGAEACRGRTPVVVDDIVSSGATMVAAIRGLSRTGGPAPVAIAVHAVFGDGADDALSAAGPARIVTTNTIPHPSNAIDVHPLVADAVRRMVGSDG